MCKPQEAVYYLIYEKIRQTLRWSSRIHMKCGFTGVLHNILPITVRRPAKLDSCKLYSCCPHVNTKISSKLFAGVSSSPLTSPSSSLILIAWWYIYYHQIAVTRSRLVQNCAQLIKKRSQAFPSGIFRGRKSIRKCCFWRCFLVYSWQIFLEMMSLSASVFSDISNSIQQLIIHIL